MRLSLQCIPLLQSLGLKELKPALKSAADLTFFLEACLGKARLNLLYTIGISEIISLLRKDTELKTIVELLPDEDKLIFLSSLAFACNKRELAKFSDSQDLFMQLNMFT